MFDLNKEKQNLLNEINVLSQNLVEVKKRNDANLANIAKTNVLSDSSGISSEESKNTSRNTSHFDISPVTTNETRPISRQRACVSMKETRLMPHPFIQALNLEDTLSRPTVATSNSKNSKSALSNLSRSTSIFNTSEFSRKSTKSNFNFNPRFFEENILELTEVTEVEREVSGEVEEEAGQNDMDRTQNWTLLSKRGGSNFLINRLSGKCKVRFSYAL